MYVLVNLHLHLFCVQRLSPATHFTDVVVVVRRHHYVVVFLRSQKILVLCYGSSLINIPHPILKWDCRWIEAWSLHFFWIGFHYLIGNRKDSSAYTSKYPILRVEVFLLGLGIYGYKIDTNVFVHSKVLVEPRFSSSWSLWSSSHNCGELILIAYFHHTVVPNDKVSLEIATAAVCVVLRVWRLEIALGSPQNATFDSLKLH